MTIDLSARDIFRIERRAGLCYRDVTDVCYGDVNVLLHERRVRPMSAAEAQEVKNLLLRSNDHYRQLAEVTTSWTTGYTNSPNFPTSPPQSKSKKSPSRNGNSPSKIRWSRWRASTPSPTSEPPDLA